MSARWSPIRGVSMWPLGVPWWCHIQPGEPVVPGDIVVFVSGDLRLWMHRVVAVRGDHLITRGDAQRREDPPVPMSAVVGRVDRLALGPLQIPLPGVGPLATAQRRLGLAWSQPAPLVRRLVRGVRARARRV